MSSPSSTFYVFSNNADLLLVLGKPKRPMFESYKQLIKKDLYIKISYLASTV